VGTVGNKHAKFEKYTHAATTDITLSANYQGDKYQDLDPRPLANNDHPSILPFEMYALEPGETPSHTLKWRPLGFLSHIKRRTIDDRFPLSLWEVWFYSTLGVQIPALIGPSQWVSCNVFDDDVCGDHLQT
jgi:hypothetical protein